MRMSFHDLETFSPVPIRHGAWAYAEEAEVLLWAYALEDGPIKVWDVASGAPMPEDLAVVMADDNVATCWHNGGMFDSTVLKLAMGIDIPLRRMHDTLVQALAHSLPGSLGDLCGILKIDTDKSKDKAGKDLIRLFCVPPAKNIKRGRATAATHPAEWAKFVDYASLDIAAMREIYRKMPRWNLTPTEVNMWHVDQIINRRGMCVDVELAECAVNAVAEAQEALRAKTHAMTNGEVDSATRRDAMLQHVLAEYGVALPDMQMATIERRIADPDLPEGLRELLKVRLQASTTSTSKYTALLNCVSSDGRLRGTKQFCGAGRTGRWAGRLFQPDNLPRPTLKQDEIDAGIEALKGGLAGILYDNVMQLTSSAIRGCVVAPVGKKLVVADLSNIEGRVLAWLAGERWKIKAFGEYDTIQAVDGIDTYWITGPTYAAARRAGTPLTLVLDRKGEPIRKGHDLYKLSYGNSFGVKPEDVTKDQRQIGKVQELACLGSETLVLTDQFGYIPILDVTTEVKVWDGENWVQHRGLIARGERETLSMAGLAVTPDHLILTGRTWKPAAQLASLESTLCQALATASASLPSLPPTAKASPSSAPAAPSPTRSPLATCAPAAQLGAIFAPKMQQQSGVRTTGPTPTLCRQTITVGDCSTGYRLASTAATTPKIAAIQTMARAASSCTKLGARIGALSWRTSSPWTGGTKPIWKWIESTLTRVMSRAISVSYRTRSTKATGAKSAPCKTPFSGSNRRMQTYDLLCAGPKNRFTVLTDRGPLIVHNCGYEGGVGAFITFAAAYGIDLESMAETAQRRIPADVWGRSNIMLEWHRKKGRDPAAALGLTDRAWLVCESFVLGWRDAHPNVVRFWRDLDAAVRAAIQKPGETVQCHPVKIRKDGAWLRIVLPSGRALCYPGAALVPEKKKNKLQEWEADPDNLAEVDTGRTIITYMGLSQYTRKWERLTTYSGKICENICQAVARDVMAANMPTVEAEMYEIVLSVHDELITEAPDHGDWNAEHLASIMATVPPWAAGLPLAAAGFEAYRYRKD